MNGKLLLFQNNITADSQQYIDRKSTSLNLKKLNLLFGFMLLSAVSLAQLPSELTGNLKLWLDASDLDGDGNVQGAAETTLMGGLVDQWIDKSPNALVINSQGATDPLYVVSDPTFNNTAVIDLNTDNYFRDDPGAWSGDHTFFIVFQQEDSVAAGTALFSSGNDGGGGSGQDDRFEISIESTGTEFVHHTTSGGVGSTSAETTFGTQAAAEVGPTLYAFTRSGNAITTYNGGVQSSTVTATTGNTFQRYMINANREETVFNDCRIAEIIIYDTVLGPEDMTRINSYLSCKYNLGFTIASPGGIDPCDIALWVKADAGIDTTGADVNSWASQGSNGFAGTATATEEPLFNTMDNNFNPSLTFNSTNNDALSLGDAAGDGMRMGAGAFSLYSVAYVDDAADRVMFSDRLCLQESGYFLKFNSVTKEWEFEAGAAAGGSYTSGDSVKVEVSNTSTNYSLLSLKRNNLEYIIKTNEGVADTGATISPVSYTTSVSGATERWIGKESACSSNNFNGSISEIIAVKADLTANEDIQIQSYLGIKYGLSLDTSVVNYLASDGTTVPWDNTILTYWHDVAGIGRDDGSMLDQRISKSQHETGIVTISNDLDFTSANNAGTRTSLTDGQFLMWGNNDVLASDGWVTGVGVAPTGYAVLPQRWLVQETNSPGAVNVQVNVNNPNNDVPVFHGDLYFAHGPNPTAPTLTPMTLDSTGYYSVAGIDFSDDDFFSFAVKNELFVEFTSSFSNSQSETILGPGVPASVVDSGIVNVATSYIVTTSGTGVGAGFASPGFDFTYANDTIPVPPGDYSTPSTNALNPLPVLIHDTDIEGAEVIEFSFICNEGVVPGDANNSGGIEDEHDLTITDDDAYNISIEKLTDGEENDAATGDATFRVFVEGGTNPTTITGDITWTGGAGNGATPGVDFDDAVTSFSFGPGTITQTINLSTGQAAYDDMLLEGTETIIGTISNLTAASGLAVTATATDTAFIADDEVTGILISIDTVGNEGTREEGSATPLSFRISLDNGVVNNSGSSIDGTIDYSGGTATPGGGDDFIPVTTFSILDGTNFVDIDINALSDNIVENTETVVPEITLTNGIGTVNVNTATAYITDEDTTGLTISIGVVGGQTGVTEGNVTTIDYVVSLSDSKINGTGADITGTVDFTGSATNLLDYNANAVPNFIIPNGSNSDTYSIILVDDMTSEPTDTLNAEIVTTSIGSPLGSNLVTIDIFDDDSGLTIVEIGSPTDTTESPIGSPFVSFEISIAAGGAAASNITGTIAYGTSPGAATAGSDFTAITTYTIPAGQLSTTINVPVLDDFLIEPSEFVIANLTGNPSLGSYGNSSATATIFDDDAANIQIVIDTVMSGAEGGQDAEFVVSIFGNLTNGTGSAIFGNVIYGGSATGADFNAIGGYDIGVGESSDTITAFITDDVLLEFTDSIYAIVTSSSIGTVAVDSALAFIYDNDLDSISISIQTPVDGVEGAPGAEVSFTIIIDDGYVNGLGVPLTGDLLFTGTATAGFDFSDFDDYSIPDGATFFIRSLPILDDQNLEQEELVIATLDNPLIPGSHNPALITDTAYIDDDDLSGALLEITGTFDGVESPGLPIDGEFSVGFVGGLVNQTGSPISGTIALAGTATEGAGNDYIGATTFVINDGSAEDIILIPIEDDLIEEPEETVIATISTTGPISLGPDSVATIKILDDESDQDNDGLPDIVDPDIDLYGPTIWNIDSDCDGIFDGCDVDADGDGVDDDGGIDRNGDGIDDAFYDVGAIDSDGDGIKDTCDADLYGPDSNGDGLSDLLWDPSDLDEDLLPDHVDPIENNPDSDNDNTPDGADYHIYGNLYNGCDADGDGIHDVADSDDNPQDGITDVGNQDSNGNGIDNDWDTSRDDEMLINYIVSPNGDGENDVLSIQGVQFIDNHELIIFNRWGTPIYRSTEYTNNWAGEIDEGVNTGAEVLGDGTYFYTLNLGDQDGDGKNDGIVRGYIEIRR